MKKNKILEETEKFLGIEFSDVTYNNGIIIAKDLKVTKRKRILTTVKIKNGVRTIKIKCLRNERSKKI
jgi:hypothetical protein